MLLLPPNDVGDRVEAGAGKKRKVSTYAESIQVGTMSSWRHMLNVT